MNTTLATTIATAVQILAMLAAVWLVINASPVSAALLVVALAMSRIGLFGGPQRPLRLLLRSGAMALALGYLSTGHDLILPLVALLFVAERLAAGGLLLPARVWEAWCAALPFGVFSLATTPPLQTSVQAMIVVWLGIPREHPCYDEPTDAVGASLSAGNGRSTTASDKRTVVR